MTTTAPQGTQITLPAWYDLHAHFRQDDILPAAVKDHLAMGCAGFLAMPNTKPPLTAVHLADETADAGSIETYLSQLILAGQGALTEDHIIVPLYLSASTTPELIESGAKSGLLKATKYYPPHGTTGAEHGSALDLYMENGVLKAMEDHGVTLCIHGEEHGLPPEDYFSRTQNAEEIFYQTRVPKLLEKFPKLKITGEHVTTKVAVDTIKAAPDHVKATITPQHLLYTVGHLLQGLKYHLYCLPLVKFDEDRAALRAAVTAADNSKFFAGTDSAPHAQKVTPCGCAAGCYTGKIAPQLYAQGFEEAGIDLSSEDGKNAFKRFLCDIGQGHYNLPVPAQNFTLIKEAQSLQPTIAGENILTPLPLGLEGEGATLPWRIA